MANCARAVGRELILIIGIMIGPVVHRFLHKFHLEGRKHE
jgi:hypothetical protein